jgi:pyruvate/2-oxoglutarate dehydrogenase complex dihydrolipoamide acyltransferase (E2) component
MEKSLKQKVKIVPHSFLRKAVSASASVTKRKNTIHFMTEVDVTNVIQEIERQKQSSIPVSITTYLTKAFALTVKKHKWMNSFISRGKQIYLDDIIISILMEREIDGVSVPEPMVVNNADKKSPWEISKEIKKAKEKSKNGKSLGDLSNAWYLKLIPGWLLKTFVRLADKNIKMGIKFGKLAITSIGMFSKKPVWVIPHGSATILLSVGTITSANENDEIKKIHLTVSFDHDVVDGAPAARFIEDLCNEIESAECLRSDKKSVKDDY